MYPYYIERTNLVVYSFTQQFPNELSAKYFKRHSPLFPDVEVHNLLVRSLDRHENHRAPNTVQKHDNK